LEIDAKLAVQKVKNITDNTLILSTRIKQDINVLKIILINIKIATAKLNHLDSGRALESTADIIEESIQKIDLNIEKVNNNTQEVEKIITDALTKSNTL